MNFKLAMLVSVAVACGGRPGSNGAGGGPVVLQNKGSDTMVNLMQRMSENYQKKDPNVIVAVTGGGSGTGIKSLIDGTTDLCNASREMKAEEIEAARKNGRDPVQTAVAYDGLAIYVHKDNPIPAISFEDLKCIYAAEGTCHKWSEVGVTLDCNGNDDIIKVGRQNNSGTYEYFHEAVIGKEGRFTNTMDQSGTQQVVDVVATSQCAIGYGGMGYAAPNVRDVCLSKKKGEPCVVPSLDTVRAGAYPFSRPLFVYTNGAPAGAAKNYLNWILSEEGQKLVVDAGFVPVPK